MGTIVRLKSLGILLVLLSVSCGNDGPCGKACGWDLGFERGNGPNKVCFCQTSDGKIYGPVPMGEEFQPAKHCPAAEKQIADTVSSLHEEPSGGSVAEDTPGSCPIE